MQLGIHIGTFARPSLDEVLDAVVAHRLSCIHFNFKAAGREAMPKTLEPAECEEIAEEVRGRGLTMASVSGTFNLIHPDRAVREDGFDRLETLAAVAENLGTKVITLCTGTRNVESMWRAHPENDSTEAWGELVEGLGRALEIAARYDVVLGVEPEVSNVMNSARKARRLLDTFASPHLKIIMDGANLFPEGGLGRMHAILDEAFELLGEDVVLAHAKDIDRDGEAGHLAAGTGQLDYDHYLACFKRVGYNGPLILHGLAESQVGASVAMLREKLAQ